MPENTQDEPLQDIHPTTTDDKAAGIVQQVAADIQLGNADVDVAAEILQRAKESGVEMTADEASTHAAKISGDSK
ncbi:hypothetical protein [Marisediminicola senii]|uniref:hypothetical protein n=1 Tax=Marisediminicola senii TaxID=2711233 RepID=UPI0013ECAF89|nr:hypothetical protein [Marisediminicola senii]